MSAKPKSIQHEIRTAFSDVWTEIRGLGTNATGRISRAWRARLQLLAQMVLVVIIVVALLGGFAIYALGWENQFTRFVGRYVPYPAAVSLHGFVRFYDYANEVERIKTYSKQTGTSVTDREASQQAMSQRLNTIAMENLAVKKKLTVTSDELSKEYSRIVAAYGGEKATLDILRKQYHTDRNQYRDLIREQLLRQKTEVAWNTDSASLDDARDQASSIMRDAQSGSDFNQLASRYSQDVTANGQGDAALIDASTLKSNIADAVKNVKDGEVVPRPLEADNAYYIVKRVKTDGDKVLVRGIVIKPVSIDRRIADEQSSAHVVRLFWPAR